MRDEVRSTSIQLQYCLTAAVHSAPLPRYGAGSYRTLLCRNNTHPPSLRIRSTLHHVHLTTSHFVRIRRQPARPSVLRDHGRKLNDDQVQGLLAILKKDTTVDAKVQYVTAIKSGIKQHNVPDSCVAPLCEGLRQASASQHAALVNAGFTALNHLLTRLSRQEPKYLQREAKQTLPLIVDKMGDQKDKFRTLALQAWRLCMPTSPSTLRDSCAIMPCPARTRGPKKQACNGYFRYACAFARMTPRRELRHADPT